MEDKAVKIEVAMTEKAMMAQTRMPSTHERIVKIQTMENAQTRILQSHFLYSITLNKTP